MAIYVVWCVQRKAAEQEEACRRAVSMVLPATGVAPWRDPRYIKLLHTATERFPKCCTLLPSLTAQRVTANFLN